MIERATAMSDLPSCASAQARCDGQVRPGFAGMNGIGIDHFEGRRFAAPSLPRLSL